MKITVSKSQWEEIGHKTGWMKTAMDELTPDPVAPSVAPVPTPVNPEEAQEIPEDVHAYNREMVPASEWLEDLGQSSYDSICNVDSKIQKAELYEDLDYYVLYEDGSLAYAMDGEEDYTDDKKTAERILARIGDPQGTLYCTSCGEKDPDTAVVDFGIGPYEYWGARGNDVQLATVTRCCESGVEDRMGHEREVPSPERDYDPPDDYPPDRD